MPDGPLACFFWRFAVTVEYRIFQRLCILDAISSPEPPTAVDQQRERDRDRDAVGFPGCLGRTSDIENDGVEQVVGKRALHDANRCGADMTKTIKPSKTIRANKRKSKLKAKHRRQRARTTG
jgi:hypothetical protein